MKSEFKILDNFIENYAQTLVSQLSTTTMSHATIYTLTIWKSENDYDNGKYFQLLGMSKELLRKDVKDYIASIEQSLDLSSKEIKGFPKVLCSLPYDELEVYELLSGLYAVKLQKQNLRLK